MLRYFINLELGDVNRFPQAAQILGAHRIGELFDGIRITLVINDQHACQGRLRVVPHQTSIFHFYFFVVV